ncbi:MAG: EAL domain-containing protein [Lachnospiraceae bacterium]
MKNKLMYINNLSFIKIIQQALIMLLPILTIGSFALVFRSLPIVVYQEFIKTFLDGLIFDILGTIYNATFNALSVFTSICIGVIFAQEYEIVKEHKNSLFVVALMSYLIVCGLGTEGFDSSYLGGLGMPMAIIWSLIGLYIYYLIIHYQKKFILGSDGSTLALNGALNLMIPILIVATILATINQLVVRTFDINNLCELFYVTLSNSFLVLGPTFIGGIIYIFFTNFFWFFGLHGSNMIEIASRNVFIVAQENNIAALANGLQPTEIYTKTFFDLYVYMGGCGTLLGFGIALLCYIYKHKERKLPAITIFPMLFNINEIMLFGFPIIFNPVMFIPFIATPIITFIIAAIATSSGLVPMVVHSVNWTTPIILGGYYATESILGSLLQLVNLMVATIIYYPFIKFYHENKSIDLITNFKKLLKYYFKMVKHENEEYITELNGPLGKLALQLLFDLKEAIKNNTLEIHYQPLEHVDLGIFGAESLLRWNHPQFGYIPPNLAIQLAKEGNFLDLLEREIFRTIKNDIIHLDIPLIISINISSTSLQNSLFIDYVIELFQNTTTEDIKICIEISESSDIFNTEDSYPLLDRLKDAGFSIAIDDFTMGKTSVKALAKYHIDYIKFDGQIIKDITEQKTQDIISSIIELTNKLGLYVIAEYVETETQAKILKKINCPRHQGYLYSKPLKLQDLIDYINKS